MDKGVNIWLKLVENRRIETWIIGKIEKYAVDSL